MKQAAYILTILMLFFTAQPLLLQCQAKIPVKMSSPEMSGCCGGNTCHKKENNKKTENKDCDRTNACNPFAGCSVCHYTAASKYFYLGSLVLNSIEQITISSEALESGFITDCWNPPKSVCS